MPFSPSPPCNPKNKKAFWFLVIVKNESKVILTGDFSKCSWFKPNLDLISLLKSIILAVMA
jgi:hypothetical protein